MKPLYPDDRRSGLPLLRADGQVIGLVVRILLITVLAIVACVVAASGFNVNEAATFKQENCAARRRYLSCELGNLMVRLIPPASAGAVALALRLGFFVLLLGSIAALLKPLFFTRRS